MKNDNEKLIEEGLAIQEMQRSEGWLILKGKIDEEIQQTTAELRQIELEGRSLSDVGAEYIAKIQRMNGLERYLGIVNEIMERFQEASKN